MLHDVGEFKMLRLAQASLRLFVVAAGLFCLTVSCTTANLPDSTPEGSAGSTPTIVAPVTSEPDLLDGTRWVLVAFESEERTPRVPERPRLFTEFRKGTLSLRGGCNSIGGHYMLEDDRITITFSKTTEMDCSASMPGINDVEVAFVTAMQTFKSYTIADDWLRIRYADGELLFRRVSD
jgi:heat shock protein HslJ